MDIIRVENLTKKFKDFTAVDGISFEVKKGEIFGFLGPNGAGSLQPLIFFQLFFHQLKVMPLLMTLMSCLKKMKFVDLLDLFFKILH